MTEEEYQKQGEEETRRGLEELRKLCNSPEFSPWKTVSRLQSPKRFICEEKQTKKYIKVVIYQFYVQMILDYLGSHKLDISTVLLSSMVLTLNFYSPGLLISWMGPLT